MHPLSRLRHQLPRRGSRGKTRCPLRGKSRVSGQGGVFRWRSHLNLSRFAANAPPQSPAAPAPPVGEPRRLLATAPLVGSRVSCFPLRGKSREAGMGVYFWWRSHLDLRRSAAKCTPSVAFGASSPGGGAERKLTATPEGEPRRLLVAAPSAGNRNLLPPSWPDTKGRCFYGQDVGFSIPCHTCGVLCRGSFHFFTAKWLISAMPKAESS